MLFPHFLTLTKAGDYQRAVEASNSAANITSGECVLRLGYLALFKSNQSYTPTTTTWVRKAKIEGYMYLSMILVGKELRLKQQYFWSAASLADIMRRFKNMDKPFKEFSDCKLYISSA
jgi:starch phosphorylase